MSGRLVFSLVCGGLLVGAAGGCRSPYHADRGALLGGVTGAGIGALVGNASGNAAAGALAGSAIGAVTGAVIGEGLDEVEARNRALIQQQMGRQISGAVTTEDVVAMTRAGLSDDVISTHIRYHGVARPLAAPDLISLKQQGVSDRVLQTMQEPPRVAAVPPPPPAAPVIVEEHYHGFGGPYWGPWGPRYYRPGPPRRGGVAWGFSFHN